MKYLLILIIIMITSSCLFSEVIVLNNGKIIRGEIIYQNDTEISVKINDDEIKITNTEVKKIYFSEKDYDDSFKVNKLAAQYLYGSFLLSGFTNFTLFIGVSSPYGPVTLAVAAIAICSSTLFLSGIPYFGAALTGTAYLITGLCALIIFREWSISLGISMIITSFFQIFAFIIQTGAQYFAETNLKKKPDKVSLILYPEISFKNIGNSSVTAGLSIKL